MEKIGNRGSKSNHGKDVRGNRNSKVVKSSIPPQGRLQHVDGTALDGREFDD